MPKIFKLSNGEYAELPDDMPEAEQFKAINELERTLVESNKQPASDEFFNKIAKSIIPERYQNGGLKEDFGNILRNLGAGGSKSLNNLSSLVGNPRQYSPLSEQKGKSNEDYDQSFGINDENRNEFVQGIPNIAASVAMPGLGAGTLAARAGAGLTQKALMGLAKSGVEGLKQGALGYGLNNPEDRAQQGTEQGLWGGGGDVLARFIGSNNPVSNLVRKLAPTAAGAYPGYKVGEHFDLPWYGKLLTTGAGAAAGHQGAKVARNLLGDTEHLARPFAQDANRSMTPDAIRDYQKAHGASERTGIGLRLDEKTGSPIHEAQVLNASKEEENVRKLHEFQRNRNRDLTISKNKTANMQSPRAVEDQISSLYETAHKSAPEKSVEKALGDFIHKDPIYAEAYEDLITKAGERSEGMGSGFFTIKTQDQIHKIISDKIKTMKAKPEEFSPRFIKNYEDADRELIKKLDSVSKDDSYSKARRAYENKVYANMIRKDTNQEFMKRLKNSGQFKELLKSNRGNRDVQKQLIDLRRVSDKLSNIDLKSVANKLPSGTNISGAAAHPAKTAKSLLDHFIDKDYKRAAMDVALDPNSAKELARLSKISNPNKLAQAIIKKSTRGFGAVKSKPGEMLDISVPYDLNEEEGAQE